MDSGNVEVSVQPDTTLPEAPYALHAPKTDAISEHKSLTIPIVNVPFFGIETVVATDPVYGSFVAGSVTFLRMLTE